jgi:hypothetical protein
MKGEIQMDFWLNELYEMLYAIKLKEGHLGKVGLSVEPMFDGLVLEISSGSPRRRYRYRPAIGLLTMEIEKNGEWVTEK